MNKFRPKKEIKCSVCGVLFRPSNPRNHLCSDKCKNTHYKNKGIKRKVQNNQRVVQGYNQSGSNNNNFKKGLWTKENHYQNKIGDCCELCSSKSFLLVHHKDKNRENCNVDNLQTLCKSCHSKIHCIRDKQGKYMSCKGIV